MAAVSGAYDDFRSVPTTRVKEFIERYAAEHYPEERRLEDFAFDSGQNPRYIYRIRDEEMPNVQFDKLDEIFTRLGCLHVWHLSPEEGGFADYYYPDIPPAPVPLSSEQRRRNVVRNAKRDAKRKGMFWLDVLHERALKDAA